MDNNIVNIEESPRFLNDNYFHDVEKIIMQLPVTPFNYQQSNLATLEIIKQRYNESRLVDSKRAFIECISYLKPLLNNVLFVMEKYNIFCEQYENIRNEIQKIESYKR